MESRAVAVPVLLVLLFAFGLGPRPGHARPQGAEESEEGTGDRFPRFELHGLLDGRIVRAEPPAAWLEGGFGRTRYGGRDRNQDGVAERPETGAHLAQASLVVEARLREDLRAHLHLNADVEDYAPDLLDKVGIVEAFGAWTPVLSEKARLRLRGGITIPPFSLEHPEVAWSTRYTITPSAIGSWLGEEVKSTGVEGTLVLTLPGFNEIDLQGGIFCCNDSTGALLAWRGWALHDRQGMFHDELPLPRISSLTDPRFFALQRTRTEPFHEIDGRPGFHGQARLRFPRGLVQAGYYDSNGDVTQIEEGSGGRNYAWDTHFAVLGFQLDLGPVTILGQYLDGRGEMGFAPPATVDAPFEAAYALVSWRLLEKSRFSVRYDDWTIADKDLWRVDKDLNDDDGWAATVAFIQEIHGHHRVMLEYVNLHAEHPFAQTAGERSRFTQQQLQAGYRFTF